MKLKTFTYTLMYILIDVRVCMPKAFGRQLRVTKNILALALTLALASVFDVGVVCGVHFP